MWRCGETCRRSYYDDRVTSDAHVDEVLAAGLVHLRSTGRVAIVGPGGIGKSTLVARLLQALAPDEVITLSADLLDHAARVESRLLDEIGDLALAGDSVDALMSSMVDKRRVAIVIDGADQIVDRVLDWSGQIPASGAGPWVVVASRVHPMALTSPVVRLGPLSLTGPLQPTLAETLFRTWYCAAGGVMAQLDAEPVELHRVLGTTGGVPLAIRVAAATSAAVGLTAARSMIIDGGRGDAVSRSIERSVAVLSQIERDVFSAFAVTSGTIDAEAAAAIAGYPVPGTNLALGTLVRHNLVDLVAGQFTMLPPVIRFAMAMNPDGLVAARIRHRNWCQSLGQVAEYQQVVLRREPDLRLAIDHGLADDPASAANLTAMLTQGLLSSMQTRQACELLTAVLAHTTLEADDLTDQRIELLRLSAIAHQESQGIAPAMRLLDEADLLLGRSTRSEYWAARLLSIRGFFLHDSGDAQAAFEMSMRAAKLAAACGDVFNDLQTRQLAVIMLQDLGRLDEAEALVATVIDACTDDTARLAHNARSSRAEIALDRGDRASCAAIARRLLAEAGHIGEAVDAEYLLCLADPVTYAPQIKAAPSLDAAHPAEWMVHLEAQACVAIAALVAGNHHDAITIASDIVVIADALPMHWMYLTGLLLVGDAALLAGDRQQSVTAYGAALMQANQRLYVTRAADAVDGLSRLIPDGDERRLALSAAASLRCADGIARRPRPWLPLLDGPGGRSSPTTALPGWINARQLSDDAVAFIVAAASRSESVAAATTTRDAVARLSPAESRVADLVAQGLTNREVGERLHIARRTVETHIVHTFQKLGVHNRTQLARIVAARTS